ncbi:hypothetical protein HPB50_012207 [Hyalomma asiaticum]|uniref:Uncharacterized protein n=1 Tax=Hyalomma asiaticum TaxID=266040 RepID=A0ACB7SQ04_HYAAI|nr:hypothetical protein HPB50_012207 [Hyalomma asiaticum]
MPEHRGVENTEDGAAAKPGADAHLRVFLPPHKPTTQGESERVGGIEATEEIAGAPGKDGQADPRIFLRPAEPEVMVIAEAMFSSEKHLQKKSEIPEEKDMILVPKFLQEGTPPAGSIRERQLEKEIQPKPLTSEADMPLNEKGHLEDKAETPTKRYEKIVIVPREELATDTRAAMSTREVQLLVSQHEAAVAAVDPRKAPSDLTVERTEIAQMAQPAKERESSVGRKPIVEQIVVPVHNRPSYVEKHDASVTSSIERDLVAGAKEPTRSTPISKDDLHPAISSDWDVMSRESLQGRPGTRTADTQTELSTGVRSKDVREASTYAFLSEETEEVRKAPDDYLPLYLHRRTLNDKALARFATYPICDVSCTVYLLPTDQQSNQPVHSESSEAPYHLMTFNDYPQDASLRLTRTAASTKQPVSAQAISRLGTSHRFSGHGKITCGTMAQFRFVRLFYFMQDKLREALREFWGVQDRCGRAGVWGGDWFGPARRATYQCRPGGPAIAAVVDLDPGALLAAEPGA